MVSVDLINGGFSQRELNLVASSSLSVYVWSLLGKVEKKSMILPIVLKTETKSTPINALIDSGAMNNLIHNNIVDQHNLLTSTLPVPINARNANGLLNQGGPIVKLVTGILNAGLNTPTSFLVANLGKNEAILGYPWLTINNPNIDWWMGEIIVEENSPLSNQLESPHDLEINLIPRKNQQD